MNFRVQRNCCLISLRLVKQPIALYFSIRDSPQDFNAKGESMCTTRFLFKTKEFILTLFSTLAVLPHQQFLLFQRTHSRQLSASKSNKRDCQSFQTKAPCKKSTTCFQCMQKHARCVTYKLNKFPQQKGTVNDYEQHPLLVTIENEKVLPQQSQRQYLIEKTLSLEKYKQ